MSTSMTRQDLQDLDPYAIAKVPADVIKLDAMELPYAWPEELRDQWNKRLQTVTLANYPNKYSHPIQEAIRQVCQVPIAASLSLGNGSDELLQQLSLLVAKPGVKVMGLEPTFSIYRRNAKIYGLNYLSVDSDEEFQIDFNEVYAKAKAEHVRLIWLAYPNNPTGIRFDHQAIRRLLELDCLLVIDEAYQLFATDTFLPLTGSVKNLIVLRTFSKVGFAGIRLGFAAGHPQVMNTLEAIMPPYNINALSLETGFFLLENWSWVQEQSTRIKYDREIMLAQLEEIDWLEVFPSEGNFLLLRVPNANALFKTLYQHKILVKNLHKTHHLLNNCLRITVSTSEINQRVIDVIRSCGGFLA